MATKLQKDWESRIKKAKTVREKWAEKFRVALGRAYFEGDQNPGLPDSEWITINKIYTHLMAQLPTMYSLDPYFYVKVKKSFTIEPDAIAEMERRGKIRQAMLNYLKVELKLKEKARLAISDAHFEYGVLKVRRAADLEDHPRAGETIVDGEGKPILDPDTQKEQVYPDTLPVNERYQWLRVHPEDLLWDADAGPLEDDWSWLAQHTAMTKKKAFKDKRFKTADIKAIKGQAPKDADGKPSLVERFAGKIRNDEDDIIHIWEIYDLDERQWLIVAEDGEKPLLAPKPTPPGIEKHPYGFLRFTLRDKSPYPIPPVSPALDPQKELSMSRSRRMTHRKRFNRKYTFDVTKVEDADIEIDKLETGDDGTIIRVIAANCVNAIQDAPLDQQNMLEEQQLANDLTEAFGSPGSSRGLADADSATEAGILDRRLEIREGDRLSMVTDLILDSARKLDQLVQQHIEKDEVLKITGPDTGGAVIDDEGNDIRSPDGSKWTLVKQDDYAKIEGEYEYSVNLGSTQPRLPDIERAQWIAFLSQVVIPFPHILTKPSIMKRFGEMFHIEDEATLEEFRQLGESILSGEMPMPGGQGGGPSNNPIAEILGKAGGPGGGNTGGGGANV